MIPHGHRTILFVMLFAAAPLFAQQPPANIDDRVKQLELRLDTLNQQMTSIRQELDALKGQSATSATAQPRDAEDLTKIDVATTQPAAPAAPQEASPSIADTQTVNNVSDPGASKVFNPDTSVIGNFLGKAGQPNPFEFGPDDIRKPMNLDEAEVAFQAWVDPYAKANVILSVSKGGIDVEEGYAQFVTLPFDLTAKAGKFKALFGKDNTWHTHVRPWIDQPLVIHNFFGDEGFNDDGISVSKTIANPWNTFIEATGEVFAGSVDNVFDRRGLNDLVYNTHLKVFRDISENSNVEMGTSYARGTLNDVHNQFAGLDVTYRWKPPQRGLYNSFIGRLEAIANNRGDADRTLKGFYASADYQLSRRLFTGIRIDSANRFVAGSTPNDRGISATLTFWPSEFSQLRGQLRRMRYGDVGRTVTEALFQLQFSIGAHGAHTF
ncbi:MAG: hypothetical protein QOK37_3 [Thermoanaerobaculia bacterium]|jgi:hypothetical protein|nr:hypothetical protein [Thermoanaerobaculia bacterium]